MYKKQLTEPTLPVISFNNTEARKFWNNYSRGDALKFPDFDITEPNRILKTNIAFF